MKVIQVAALVLEDQHKRILIGQRRQGDSNEGKWEFPGGKVERDESFEQALHREIREELTLELEDISFFHETCYQYPLIKVHIQFFYAQMKMTKELAPHAHQKLQWVSKQMLDQYDFLDANKQVLAMIGK
ncbi:MAG: (deoxy)nucleoside triphosphate pyrophosphohydrolase [Bdellovibrionota bacterium]